MVAVTFNTFAEILPSYAFGSFFVEQGMFHFQGPCRILLLLVLILLLLFSPQSLWSWWCLSILCGGAKSFPTYNKDHHPPRQGLDVASYHVNKYELCEQCFRINSVIPQQEGTIKQQRHACYPDVWYANSRLHSAGVVVVVVDCRAFHGHFTPFTTTSLHSRTHPPLTHSL